eukprot:TRINITY_DN718_c0_g1_i3.p1 TRINITY_DN718_c0_g1~~TRINITY_DN718_c0_g1_i3.p1  ORF type:complete len:520 (+),score=118.10 TRINITY_DN718_c0_g1_i3:88-1647(+)
MKTPTTLLLLAVAVALMTFSTERIECGSGSSHDWIVRPSDYKAFKKHLKAMDKTLVLFYDGTKPRFFKEYVLAADRARGKIAAVDCSAHAKLCKTAKVKPSSYILQQYTASKPTKKYPFDVFTARALSAFAADPSAPLPWRDDPSAVDVKFLNDGTFHKVIKKGYPTLVMVHAPWCGHCKTMKPHFAAAAKTLKGKALLVSIDAEDGGRGITTELEVDGYPTLILFNKGKRVMNYSGGNTAAGIVQWMKNPSAPPPPPAADPEWHTINSEVVHLTDANFHDFVGEHSAVLVMFYAPWCGHCKTLKPHYGVAAARMKEEGIEGVLAALDATIHREVPKEFDVDGYPTLMFFRNGKYQFNFHGSRSEAGLIKFMTDPSAPAAAPPPEPGWSAIKSDVKHLTAKNFDNYITKKPWTLVLFYTPWCGHCKKLKPQYQQAAADLTAAYSGAMTLAAIDCDEHEAPCSARDVSSYPTMKLFNKGETLDAIPARNKDAIVEFMKHMAGVENDDENVDEDSAGVDEL